MKKLILNLILTITMLTSVAYASDNSLNAVIVEGTPSGYNIILRSDKVANVKKVVQQDGTLLLDLKNISTAVNLDTRYVNANNINNMVVENVGNNEVKIYIQAKNIGKADIIFDTPATPPVVVGDGLSKKDAGWIATAFLLICLFAGSFRRSVEKDDKALLRKALAEREIKMYKDMKSDIMTSARIDDKLRRQVASRNATNSNRSAQTIRSLQKMSMR